MKSLCNLSLNYNWTFYPHIKKLRNKGIHLLLQTHLNCRHTHPLLTQAAGYLQEHAILKSKIKLQGFFLCFFHLFVCLFVFFFNVRFYLGTSWLICLSLLGNICFCPGVASWEDVIVWKGCDQEDPEHGTMCQPGSKGRKVILSSDREKKTRKCQAFAFQFHSPLHVFQRNTLVTCISHKYHQTISIYVYF